MQFPGQGKPSVGIVFDAGFTRIDDVLALALIHGFDSKGEARLASLSISTFELDAARFCDAVERFYAGTGPFAASFRGLPVGLSADGKPAKPAPMVTAPFAKQTPDGKPALSTGVQKLNDTADPAPLIRNALTAQHDANALVVLGGAATNLAKVLELEGTKDLIGRKVKILVIASDGAQQDIPAARKLFTEWPTPIVLAGSDIGDSLLFPASSIDQDFAWSPAHPVVEAYRAYKPMPYDAPTWSLSAVIHAVRPQDGYFKVSEPGTISVLDNGRTKFASSPDGKHRQLTFDPEQKERILKVYTELASAKPVQRRPRFLQQQDEEKKKAEEKKKHEQVDEKPSPPEK